MARCRAAGSLAGSGRPTCCRASDQEAASHHAVLDAVSVPRMAGGVVVRPVFAVATRKLPYMPALANAPPIWLLPRAKFGSVVPFAYSPM